MQAIGRGKGRGKNTGTPRPRKSRKKVVADAMQYPMPPVENMNIPADSFGMMSHPHNQGIPQVDDVSLSGVPGSLMDTSDQSAAEQSGNSTQLPPETSIFNFTEDEEPPPPLHCRDLDGKKLKSPRYLSHTYIRKAMHLFFEVICDV